jgi:Alkylmercury lyase
MLFFRSEERVDEWCRARGLTKRPLITLEQLWQLAVAWYSSRLDPGARRPGPDEMRAIFARIGLTGPFWDPQSDHFGA